MKRILLAVILAACGLNAAHADSCPNFAAGDLDYITKLNLLSAGCTATAPTAGAFTSLTLTAPLDVIYGGTGRATGTTAYGLLAAGTTATGAQQTLAAGTTSQILVGGGASALPVWTTATGSGAPVRATSPTLVTPTLGAATASSVNKVALTAPATSATLTIADGKTATVSNTLTFAGTDGSTLNVGAGGTLGSAAYKSTGTSGNTVPLLDAANTWSANQMLTANLGVGASAAPATTVQITSGANSYTGGLSILRSGANAGTIWMDGSDNTLNIGRSLADNKYWSMSSSGNVSQSGYTSLGEAAPKIKLKKISGTTAASQGGTASVAHGLTGSKILAVNVIVTDGNNIRHPPGNDQPVVASAVEYQVYVGSANLVVALHPTNSSGILSAPFTALITYEE